MFQEILPPRCNEKVISSTKTSVSGQHSTNQCELAKKRPIYFIAMYYTTGAILQNGSF